MSLFAQIKNEVSTADFSANDSDTNAIKRKADAPVNDLAQMEDLNLCSQQSTNDENSTSKKLRQNDENTTNVNKSALQILNDLIIHNKCKVKFDIIGQEGPPHAKVFQIKCVISDAKNAEVENYLASGTSINKAKQAAAEQALAQTKLERNTVRKNKPNFQQQKQQYKLTLIEFL